MRTLLSVAVLGAAIALTGFGCTSDQSDPNEQISKTSAPSRADLVGGWQVIKSEMSFSNLILDENGDMYAFLNDRPFGEGRWEYEGGTLHLYMGNDESLKDTYTNVTLVEDMLTLKYGPITTVWLRAAAPSPASEPADGGTIKESNDTSDQVTKVEFTGTWDVVEGYPPFTTIAVKSDGTYVGNDFNGDPLDEGTWLLTGGKLSLDSKFDLLQSTFTVTKLDSRTIELTDGSMAMRWQKAN